MLRLAHSLALTDSETWKTRNAGLNDEKFKPFRPEKRQPTMLNHFVIMQATADSGGSGGAALVHAGAPACPEVLDRDALARLRELDPSGEAQLLERVVEAFKTSTARLLPQMRNAGVAGDLNGVRYGAHTLKSSSASLGALRLSQLCADLERQARTGEAAGAESQVEEIATEIEVVVQALKVMMDSAQ